MKRFRLLSALSIVIILTVSLFSGCSKASDPNTKVLNLYNWGDYIDPSLIDKFEKETGIKVNYSTYDTNEIMYAKIKDGSSNYDLVIPSDYMIEKMIKENLVEKLDFNNIPNYKYIGKDFKHLSYDPKDEYSVPYMWGTIGIVYNTKMVKKPVDSWNILWDKEYKDQIIMFNSVRDAMAIALKKLGYSMNSENPEQIKQAADALIEEKPLVQAYMVDEVKDAMVSGEAAVAPVWSGDAAVIMSENPDIKYVIPKEGSNEWFDALVIPKGAKHKKEAEMFINFLCDPENALQNVEYIGYQTPNTKTFEMLPEDMKEEYPTKEELSKCQVFTDLNKETLKLYNDEWIRIFS
ncbi:spermidine/putrescine ABC transporter substrate-binding protein [Clostridium baratii]|uniref:ABC transporter substrate-binding protein n=1 Tax=Clostridium baratii TaxID=1561 RepID=UPI0009A2C2BF|nr:ABC transporter substrate-binding protein [Clostridium baratii]OPF51951.1 spermidine/putrescine ABC transporter substrate-binding protein [Clostridium baratii]OPF53596.1 spermidine/putrescine ABC transporter substrate-binding protein [Clostridium baratii]OPF56471.1 spermidine/putrescine ABC transporter substrate-binding protein [Clostridium baratii]OPF60643.1 spermidine/putrescine ABC transporter substrate-binding protein [Clostridium baratii]